MTFTSFSFLIFMAATLVVYYVCPIKFRWIILLLTSGTFYGIVCLKYLPFLSFTINGHKDAVNLKTNEDFYDAEHVNIFGAEKLNKDLAGRIGIILSEHKADLEPLKTWD